MVFSLARIGSEKDSEQRESVRERARAESKREEIEVIFYSHS
jgi:hypothetical protein